MLKMSSLLSLKTTYTAEEPGSIALSDEEAQALDRLRNRCRSVYTRFSFGRPDRIVAETCVNYVQLWIRYPVNIRGSANVTMEIIIHENGFKHWMYIDFTVFALPGISRNLLVAHGQD